MLVTDLRQSTLFPAPFRRCRGYGRVGCRPCRRIRLDISNLFFVGDSAGAHLATAYTAVQLNEAYANSFPGIKVDERFIPKGLLLNCGVFDMEVEWKKQGRALTPFLTDFSGGETHR